MTSHFSPTSSFAEAWDAIELTAGPGMLDLQVVALDPS
jgi:hypothetical protein